MLCIEANTAAVNVKAVFIASRTNQIHRCRTGPPSFMQIKVQRGGTYENWSKRQENARCRKMREGMVQTLNVCS